MRSRPLTERTRREFLAGSAGVVAEGTLMSDGNPTPKAHDGMAAFSQPDGDVRPVGGSEGVLTLVFESPGMDVLSGPDNVTVSPRGGVLVCEEGDADVQYLRGLPGGGKIFDLAANAIPGETDQEWCGATFGPDGRILFVSI